MTLDPVAAGGPYNVTAKVQNDSATLTDVLFGDIWMCGGQSNMWFNMTQVRLSVCADIQVMPYTWCQLGHAKTLCIFTQLQKSHQTYKAKSSFFLKCI